MNTLRPYQEEAVAFLLAHPRAYLADVMGLGKTVAACSAALRLRVTRVLVVGPAIARHVWADHFKIWAPNIQPWILSYDQLVRMPKADVQKLAPFDLVILDEAHYCKNLRSARAKRALYLAQRAARSWLLSGTPMPNHPGELFAPIAALWPAKVRSATGGDTYRAWLDTFCVWTRNEWGGVKVWKPRNAMQLRALLFSSPACMLRRREADVELQLPPLDTYVVSIEAPLTETLQAAQRVAADELLGHAGEIPATPAQATLRRLCGEVKAAPVARLISDELTNGAYQKIVLFAYHHSVLDVLQRALAPEHGAVRIDGHTSDANRQRAQRDFARADGPQVLLGQTRACGVALTLITASQVGVVEPSWTPEEDHQAVKRIHRFGQTKRCTARLFALEGTLDRDIMAVRERKIQMIEETVR